MFEGRDAAGKGGTIKAITERVSPRVFRLVALPAPSDREKTQIYMQRYIAHFPAAGEIVIFDRSWYNRAGVEYVLGFCSKEQHRRFLDMCPLFEKQIVESGIRLLKYWLEVGPEEQKRRFQARIEDPLRQWKLSPTDLESRRRWYGYSHARDMMLEATDTKDAPWHIVKSDDKKRARLSCIRHLLEQIPYQRVPSAEDRAGEPLAQGRLRRRGPDEEAPLDPGGLLNQVTGRNRTLRSHEDRLIWRKGSGRPRFLPGAGASSGRRRSGPSQTPRPCAVYRSTACASVKNIRSRPRLAPRGEA